MQAYNALWALAEESTLLTSLVKPGNRVKFNRQTRSSPVKDEVSDSDLPELTLVVTQLSGKLRNTSSTSMALVQYEWLIATGDPSVVRNVLPVMWAIFAAMAPWPSTAFALTWREKTFVKRLDMLEANLGLTDPDRNRGIDGWSAIWSSEVEMHFATTDVISSRMLEVS